MHTSYRTLLSAILQIFFEFLYLCSLYVTKKIICQIHVSVRDNQFIISCKNIRNEMISTSNDKHITRLLTNFVGVYQANKDYNFLKIKCEATKNFLSLVSFENLHQATNLSFFQFSTVSTCYEKNIFALLRNKYVCSAFSLLLFIMPNIYYIHIFKIYIFITPNCNLVPRASVVQRGGKIAGIEFGRIIKILSPSSADVYKFYT